MADSVPVGEEVPLPQPQVPTKGMRRKSIAIKKKKHKHKRVLESDNDSIDFVASTPNDEEYQKTVASTPNGEEYQKTQEQETHADPEMEESSKIKKRKRTGEEKKKKKKKDKGLYDENETTTPMDVADEPTKEDVSSAKRALCLEDPKEDNADCGEKKTTPTLKSCDEFEVVQRVISELELQENGDRLDSPEQQTNDPPVEEATSKVKSSRVWSEEDEVAILRGIIRFKDEKGMEPRDNAKEFHEFVKDSLRLQSATVVQLKDKMRRLKDKYEKYVAESRTLNGPHEEELFNLSHKIWSIPVVKADDEKHPSGGDESCGDEKHPSGGDEKHQLGRKEERQSGYDEKTARRLRRREKRQQTMEEQSDTKNVAFYDTIKLSNFDKSCAEELDSILKVMAFGGSNSKKTIVNQMELSLKSLHIREAFVSKVLQSSVEEDSSELEKEDLMMSYSKAKMEHARLISEAFASLVKDRNQAQ